MQEKQGQKAIELFGDIKQKGESTKSCAMDLNWWLHLAHWRQGHGETALQCLRNVMRLAAELHQENRFTTAAQVPFPSMPFLRARCAGLRDVSFVKGVLVQFQVCSK